MAESWDMGGSMNYLYHMKVVFDLLLNNRDRNKDANEFWETLERTELQETEQENAVLNY
jgi:hypothetical protein